MTEPTPSDSTPHANITFFGNLGGDPVRRHTRPRARRPQFDPRLEELIEQPAESRPFVTYRVAAEFNSPRGIEKITKWFTAIDFHNPPLHGDHPLRKGDRVKIGGRLQRRAFVKDGEERTELRVIVDLIEPQPRKDAL